ncbi:histidine phosphatase family protein [Novosphingobium profundi]|uniref:histidine phosphatase family protein n=1 Tax=Novosphingobium profundi TaxID=1774954 RepID=UPI001BDA7782|nr:histidine phosphatase family protein [Novosphingobium profundi]MBT0667451.1 histidine phosphatase family protein [Novosphingobium profundi]
MSARVVHLVRHVPPLRPGLLLGHCDLSAELADCPQLRTRVANLAISRIVSSDLRRCSVQAARLAETLQVPLALAPDWRELDFGAWDGFEPGALDAEAVAAFWDDPEANPPPYGERWSQLCRRIERALRALPDKALVVTHAGSMRAALSVLTGLDHRGVWALDVPYRARLSLRIWEGDKLSGQVIGLDTGPVEGEGAHP